MIGHAQDLHQSSSCSLLLEIVSNAWLTTKYIYSNIAGNLLLFAVILSLVYNCFNNLKASRWEEHLALPFHLFPRIGEPPKGPDSGSSWRNTVEGLSLLTLWCCGSIGSVLLAWPRQPPRPLLPHWIRAWWSPFGAVQLQSSFPVSYTHLTLPTTT